MEDKNSFLNHFTQEPIPPLSFVCGGVGSPALLPDWTRADLVGSERQGRVERTPKWSDEASGLNVECKLTEYVGFQALEWTLYIKNTGTAKTPILEQLWPLDVTLCRSTDEEFVLHHSMGSRNDKLDFQPLCDTLGIDSTVTLSPVGGRSSDGAGEERKDGAFPFFNLEYDGGGIIFAVGWSGGWRADFARDSDKSVRVTAGMGLTHLTLHPGEEIRTPKMLMFFYEGDRASGLNTFRRFILEHHTPHKDGKPVTCPVAMNTWFAHNYGNGVTEENQVEAIRQMAESGVGIEDYWLDAGWYGGVGNWAIDVGNWFPKETAFPRGLKPVADEARKHGMGFVLWFEPERVCPNTWLYNNHPEWLLMPSEAMKQKRPEALFDLGNPEARAWLIDHISSMIEENGVTIYRQDFNFDPIQYWRNADTSKRQGITEIRYITGLYEFWDELLRRHSGLLIDNCASGGRRIDLETISRSVALWRSDCAYDPEGVQSHGMGINEYLPCSGTGAFTSDAYAFRSNLGSSIALCWGAEGLAPDVLNVDELRQRIDEFKMLRPLFYGDFYPLTQYSAASDVWCTYQLWREDMNRGAVLAFRRRNSPYPTALLKLHGLLPDAQYELTNIDTRAVSKLPGKEVMDSGIAVYLPNAPESVIIMFSRLDRG